MLNNGGLLLENAIIYTFGDPPGPVESLAIQDGHILAIGDREDLLQTIPSNFTKLDLGGRVILPGLTDSHIHFEKFSLNHEQINCETNSVEECLARIQSRADTLQPGEWIRGHGWDQNLWGRYGTKEELDRVTAGNPAYITAKSLHAAWANTVALNQAGLSAKSVDPPKGNLQRGEDGNLTGILFEFAMLLISDLVPRPSPSDLSQIMLRGQDELLRLGITSIHDFDGKRCLQALQILREDSLQRLRVVKSIRFDDFESAIDAGLRTGFGDDWIRVGAVKLFSDGALGPHTAAMLKPYEDDNSNSGFLLLTAEEIAEIGKRAAVNGLALAIHAIGDRANRVVLDAFEELRTFEAKNRIKPLPHRIEHLQLISTEDTQRPADLDIIVSMQPIHAVSDMQMANHYWGDRVQQSYGWRSQIRAGSKLIFGSDAPVDTANPFIGIYAAVSRKPLGCAPEADSWVPDQRINLQEALNAYSVWPAQSMGLGSKLGKLLPGYLADLIVLDEDPFLIDNSELPAIKPSGVMVNGKWHFLD
ncbi:MAG: amidohydrolase family protein [Anaerolineales bacterium]|nr:amidohydrolase family protein [Anaerolineales bacterium]